jgi:hypothetical protein
MKHHRRGAVLTAVLSLVCVAAEQAAPSADEPGEVARAREFLELAGREAAAYELRHAEGELERHKDPVLRWSNPVIGEIYGGIFLWTRRGRPEAVASIFKWYSPHTHMTHEFQSLSTKDLTATRDGGEFWRTSRGVEPQPIPGAPAPARSRAGRLRQMRELARQFSATLNREDVVHSLRLLTQPLYRYGDGGDEWTDGALFGFVLGTDPDVLLLIEARPGADGGEAWHFAPARMHWRRVSMLHQDREVWQAPELSNSEIHSGTKPYTQIEFREPREK